MKNAKKYWQDIGIRNDATAIRNVFHNGHKVYARDYTGFEQQIICVRVVHAFAGQLRLEALGFSESRWFEVLGWRWFKA